MTRLSIYSNPNMSTFAMLKNQLRTKLKSEIQRNKVLAAIAHMRVWDVGKRQGRTHPVQKKSFRRMNGMPAKRVILQKPT